MAFLERVNELQLGDKKVTLNGNHDNAKATSSQFSGLISLHSAKLGFQEPAGKRPGPLNRLIGLVGQIMFFWGDHFQTLISNAKELPSKITLCVTKFMMP